MSFRFGGGSAAALRGLLAELRERPWRSLLVPQYFETSTPVRLRVPISGEQRADLAWWVNDAQPDIVVPSWWDDPEVAEVEVSLMVSLRLVDGQPCLIVGLGLWWRELDAVGISHDFETGLSVYTGPAPALQALAAQRFELVLFDHSGEPATVRIAGGPGVGWTDAWRCAEHVGGSGCHGDGCSLAIPAGLAEVLGVLAAGKPVRCLLARRALAP